jgi:hypothetical protein
MPEFTIEIDTNPGTVTREETLLEVDELLRAHTDVAAPVLSLNTETGVLGATFQIMASNPSEASAHAIRTFSVAIASALSHAVDELAGTIELEEAAEVDRLLVERVRDREAVPA